MAQFSLYVDTGSLKTHSLHLTHYSAQKHRQHVTHQVLSQFVCFAVYIYSTDEKQSIQPRIIRAGLILCDASVSE